MDINSDVLLIADYMGMKYSDERSYSHEEGWTHSEYSLRKFYESWDWLLNAVEYIEKNGWLVIIQEKSCIIRSNNENYSTYETRVSKDTKKDSVFEAVVKFIKANPEVEA